MTEFTNTPCGYRDIVHISPPEEELFQLLLDALRWNEERTDVNARPEGRTILRVAGGWVRDKLLQHESADIDIALNNMSGVTFAHLVNEYLESRQMTTRTIAVISANPEQSKHLETANLRVLGYEIDCVNLRAETYTDTRIPEVRLGTALEDAQRRDFTINALFYNINERAIEDFTGQGLSDLITGIIRTPISPFVTFKDDPLRVLRAIRFGSRYNFHFDGELLAAAQHPEIRTALIHKVSRERVYKECEGMIFNFDPTDHQDREISAPGRKAAIREVVKGSRPALSLGIMHRMCILDSIFPFSLILTCYPPAPSSFPVSGAVGCIDGLQQHLSQILNRVSIEIAYSLNLLLHFPFVDSQGSLSASQQALPVSGPHIKFAFYASLLIPFHHLKFMEKKKEVMLSMLMLRDGLKMENVSIKNILAVVDAAEAFRAIATQRGYDQITIDEAGGILRQARDMWRMCILVATAHCIAHLTLSSGATLVPVDGDWFQAISVPKEVQDVVDGFQKMQSRIDAMGLEGVWDLKPLLDGSVLIKELQLPKGPVVGKVLETMLQWQIRTKSTDIAACLQYLRAIPWV